MHKPNKINRQIAGLIAVVILFALAFCCIINTCFLGDFYLYRKAKNMGQVFETLRQQDKTGSLYTDDLQGDLLTFSDKYSFSILIVDDEEEVVSSSSYYNNGLVSQLNYLESEDSARDSVVRQGKDYTVFSVESAEAGEEYLCLIGQLNDDGTVFIRSSMQGIDEAAGTANLFMVVICIFAVLVSSIIGYLLINKYTKPLFDIISITKRISNFDFTVKYAPQKIYNELDDLGEHINEMSSTLERAINQLQKANESLKHDLEVREETENMRKEFISNVSHELKTPIALIQGYAEGLQEGIMDDENSRQIYLDVIIDEANKMNRLVREMLILNQLEAGQMKADLEDFNLTDILNGIIDSNKLYFQAQDIQFSFVGEEPVMVLADEFLVEQVFTNFMSNAIHYVMNENIITVRYDFAKKGKVRISVFNSGNNIPKKDIKQIWDKFYKADKARSREYGGSGIGLSVVKATMELLNEKFGVENLQNGVEFWFELSLSKDEKFKQNS